jgi:hypothetical protein
MSKLPSKYPLTFQITGAVAVLAGTLSYTLLHVKYVDKAHVSLTKTILGVLFGLSSMGSLFIYYFIPSDLLDVPLWKLEFSEGISLSLFMLLTFLHCTVMTTMNPHFITDRLALVFSLSLVCLVYFSLQLLPHIETTFSLYLQYSLTLFSIWYVLTFKSELLMQAKDFNESKVEIKDLLSSTY